MGDLSLMYYVFCVVVSGDLAHHRQGAAELTNALKVPKDCNWKVTVCSHSFSRKAQAIVVVEQSL